ncbi:hypothetical protein BT69DRAFT_1278745 [Atractiella rhizophila]|nr:hypothetical protein BT69DRAFT_1278745 [Atractiella rhizophila]
MGVWNSSFLRLKFNLVRCQQSIINGAHTLCIIDRRLRLTTAGIKPTLSFVREFHTRRTHVKTLLVNHPRPSTQMNDCDALRTVSDITRST